MSEAKHTPGPWSVSDKNASGNVSEDYLFIEPGIAVIERKVAGQNECDMPDARLIAAAPELLEALQLLDEAYCNVSPTMTRQDRANGRTALIRARAAITRATGAE